ncbi:hypothetical protein [Undibacterium sp.]|uniref:hypothetical protein n=1 Tax=Undibacterium sp. TaxID=1914977 RepID=UPI00374D5194
MLLPVCVSASAEPGRFGNFFSFGKSQASEQKEAHINRATDKKMEKEAIAEEHADNKRLPAASPSAANTDTSQKRSRMTPDERRALRRQINEAGHDIYVPGR